MNQHSFEGWIFSEGNPPKQHTGGLLPKHARGYKNPWAYIIDINHWFEFNHWSSCAWEPTWHNKVPKEYLMQLLLIK